MVEITLPIVLQILQTSGILVGIVYYITIMRNNQRANRLYTFQQRMQTMDRSHFQAYANVLEIDYETYEEWREKYRSGENTEVYADWCYIGGHYHNVGYLLKHGLVDSDTVFELYPPASILRVWRYYEVVLEAQKSMIGSYLWGHFKYLKDEAEKRFPEIKIPDYA
jgi:hypothetical protein